MLRWIYCDPHRATQARQEKLFDYTFTISSADDLPPIEWKFTTPEYKEPEKKQRDQVGASNKWTRGA